jgi:hypothetical protein
VVLTLVVLSLAVLAGCRDRSAGVAPAADAAEWKWMVDKKVELDALRVQLQAAGGPAPAGSQASDTASEREPLEHKVAALSAEFDRRLVAYINTDPPIEGSPLSERQLAAIRMRSDEEIAVAQETIARSGDYRRACEILEAALGSDPQNGRLHEELDRALADRFMAPARFSRATVGMTGEQVRAVLGQPNLHDILNFPARGVVGWFYPRDASGAAAAVWFTSHAGSLKAYLCDWNALPPPGAEPRATAANPPQPPPPPADDAPAAPATDGP